MEIPVYVKDEFADFYKAMLTTVHAREKKRVVFTEYFWNMGWCDPCAADPLTPQELLKLGAFWLRDLAQPPQGMPTRRPPRNRGVDALLTRLHVRKDAETFPEDLMFHETADKRNFQGRFILRHPWTGSGTCAAADTYRRNLVDRREKRAQNLAHLTGWDIGKIRKKMGARAPPPEKKNWWEHIFN
jgi:hypothetical protein